MSEEFKSWEELTPLEQAACTFWDAYKDAHGFRPRHIDTSTWTLEQFDKELEELCEIMKTNDIAQKIDEALAIEKFERRVAELISMGAKDYTMAMRWIHEAEETNGDDSYLAWTLGLPYRFFAVKEVA